MSNWKIEFNNFDAFKIAFKVGLGLTGGIVSALALLYAIMCVCQWVMEV